MARKIEGGLLECARDNKKKLWNCELWRPGKNHVFNTETLKLYSNDPSAYAGLSLQGAFLGFNSIAGKTVCERSPDYNEMICRFERGQINGSRSSS